jgi:hypothetical protein
MSLLHELDDGKKHKISEEMYDYFLDVLPPVAYDFNWNGEHWGFGFAEGADFIYGFKKQGQEFFAQKTTLVNPREIGIPIEEQLQKPEIGQRFAAAQLQARTQNWIPTWLKLGKQNPWIREANDPPFTTKSFHVCVHDDELLDKFAHGNWSLGQAFVRDDLCFINQVDGGDEWLAIRRDRSFESISWGAVLANRGREGAKELLDQLKSAPEQSPGRE